MCDTVVLARMRAPALKGAAMAEEPHILLVDDERDIRDPLAA